MNVLGKEEVFNNIIDQMNMGKHTKIRNEIPIGRLYSLFFVNPLKKEFPGQTKGIEKDT